MREMTNLRDYNPLVVCGERSLQSFGLTGRVAEVRAALNHESWDLDALGLAELRLNLGVTRIHRER
jgi:hypothetical protein